MHTSLPTCGDREILDLNEFGHPVCICFAESMLFYPLLPSLRFTKDEKNLGKCFTTEESSVCNVTEYLTVINQDYLTCSNVPKPQFSWGFCGTCYIPGRRCPLCETFRYNKCRPISNCCVVNGYEQYCQQRMNF